MTPTSFLRELIREWKNDNVSRLAAAMAYYMLFSLPSALLIIAAIASVFLQRDTVTSALLHQINTLFGPTAAETFAGVLAASPSSGSGILATLIGGGVLLFGAMGLFGETRRSLQEILRPNERESGIYHTLRWYAVAFVLLFLAVTLVFASIALTSVLTSFSDLLSQWLLVPQFTLVLADLFVTYALMAILFFILYKSLAGRPIPAVPAFAGASMATLLFIAGKFLLSLYLRTGRIGWQYDVPTSLLVLLFWIYYSCQVFLIGAEFVDLIDRRRRHVPACPPERVA